MKNINELINSQLTRSIKSNDKLSDFVYSLLHLNKEKHKIWVISKQQKLTILTDNPYLATQINYQKETICKALNREFLLELKTSKVKIIPPTGKIEKEKKRQFIISEKTSEVLKNIAADIQDNELRDQLVKLAKGNNK